MKNESVDNLDTDGILVIPDKYLKLIVFLIEDQEFAFYIDNIVEISNIKKITRVPNTHKIFSGLVNLRGKIIVVINLGEILGLKQNLTDESKILIFEINKDVISLVVDKVVQIMTVRKDSIQDITILDDNSINSRYVKGVFIKDKRMISILDESVILNDENLFEIMNTIRFNE